MPGSAPVNVSTLSDKVAGALRNLHEPLLDAHFSADPVMPLIEDSKKLILELRRIVNLGNRTPEEEGQVLNTIENLERFHEDAKRLVTISDDIEGGPAIRDLGVLREQWSECCRGLLNILVPVSRSLDPLSEMARAWYPGELALTREDCEEEAG